MLTTFVVFDDAEKAIHQAPCTLSLAQKRNGLHVVSTLQFKAHTRVTVSRVEIELGNRTWVEEVGVDLWPDDSIAWNMDLHLTDTA